MSWAVDIRWGRCGTKKKIQTFTFLFLFLTWGVTGWATVSNAKPKSDPFSVSIGSPKPDCKKRSLLMSWKILGFWGGGQLYSTWTPILLTVGAISEGWKVSQWVSTWFQSVSCNSWNSSCNELWGLQAKHWSPKLQSISMNLLSNVHSLPLMEMMTW